MLVTWTDLAARPPVTVPFLVDPYIPREGTVLLYAKTSRGKSPFTWELARAVGTGTPFFGRYTTPGRVLYLEVDTPEILVQHRLAEAELAPAPNVWFLFAPPFDILRDEIMGQRLKHAAATVRPSLVIVNTLRKVYVGDDISSEMPKRVYSRFQALFPSCAIVFSHHERKTRGGAESAFIEEREDFAGTAAWLNDCTVGLHLLRDPKPKDAPGDKIEYLRLQHEKSQVSELHAPIHLALRGGAHWTVLNDEERAAFVSIWHATPGGHEDKRKAVGAALGMSRTTVGQRAKGYGLLNSRPGRISRPDKIA